LYELDWNGIDLHSVVHSLVKPKDVENIPIKLLT